MITPLLFVKILRTTRNAGGFSANSRDINTHRITVARGAFEFVPVSVPGLQHHSCHLGDDGLVESLAVAKTKALNIAKMLGIESVQLYRKSPGGADGFFHIFEEEVIEE